MGSSTKTLLALGFITVRHHSEHGYFGGYLIINQLARPLEFHCTLPVKPTRAQSLLYGNTVDDFFCGEQIAKALVAKAKLKPTLLLTDSSSVLAFENVGDEHIVLVHLPDTDNATNLRTPGSNAIPLRTIQGKSFSVQCSQQCSYTSQMLNELTPQLAPNFDVMEPFQRIAEALIEAHPIVKAA
jgi:hypothetical protein